MTRQGCEANKTEKKAHVRRGRHAKGTIASLVGDVHIPQATPPLLRTTLPLLPLFGPP